MIQQFFGNGTNSEIGLMQVCRKTLLQNGWPYNRIGFALIDFFYTITGSD